ncbi:MAG: glutaredoxin family protein [Betaproteobacteria bacterium]|nr:glutaredoxin family protein [Betaproteobacteria bacterium]
MLLPRITLYSRKNCHLCDDMLKALEALRVDLHFHLDVIDVDANPDLARRYGELVPVLAAGASVICQYRLNVSELRATLSKIR